MIEDHDTQATQGVVQALHQMLCVPRLTVHALNGHP